MRALIALCLFLGLVMLATGSEHESWLREPNITLNYSRIPWVLRGITPQLTAPLQLKYDIIQEPQQPPRLDPRTCPGEIAHCYDIREHNFTGELTYGKNFTATSNYTLPEQRIKTYLCIGDDLACVAQSTNCFCTDHTIPKPVIFLGMQEQRCDDTQHLCRDTYSTLTLCTGNLSSCRDENIACGCGPHAACTSSTQNVCINTRNELILCDAKLAQCLTQYDRCFCGQETMEMQKGCTELRHTCTTKGKETVCVGKFSECALQFESCTCGTE